MNHKILIIDDDPDFRDATQTLLEAKGYGVLSAENGEQGYQKARGEQPSVVLLDVMMTHDSEGFGIARKLHEDPMTGEIPVIMITGIRTVMKLPDSPQPDEEWLPVKAILEKPVKPEVLLKNIKDALDK